MQLTTINYKIKCWLRELRIIQERKRLKNVKTRVYKSKGGKLWKNSLKLLPTSVPLS